MSTMSCQVLLDKFFSASISVKKFNLSKSVSCKKTWAYSSTMTTKVFEERTRGKFVLEDKIGQKH